jgi:hypothetical protein
MRQEDMQVGQKVWRAAIVDGIDGKDRLFVTEYEVAMVGKARFELRGARSAIRGLYSNNRELLQELQPSPAAAAGYLSARLDKDLKDAEASYRRTAERLREHEQLLRDWFNKAAL